MLTRHRPSRRSEDGFTLIELVISIGILGVVFSAMSLAMFGALRANKETTSRVDLTRDEQFAAAYFGGDVAGANSMSAGGSAACGATGTAIAAFSGQSFDDRATSTVTQTWVGYLFKVSTVGSVTSGQLTRLECETGFATTTPPDPRSNTHQTVVARSLTTTAPPVTCRNSDHAVETCAATSTSMTMTLNRLGSGAPVVLSGTRRSSPTTGAVP